MTDKIKEALEALEIYNNASFPDLDNQLKTLGALLDPYLKTIRNALQAQEWQPIETAPKHERILMLMKHGAIEGTWDGETGYGYYWRDIEWWPTHWMPLPQPPKKGGG